MAILTLPDALRGLINSQTWSQLPYQAQLANPITGASMGRVLGPSRWSTVLSTHQALRLQDVAALDALRMELDGSVNQLALYDVKHQQPRGTLRGTLTLNAAAAQGATSIAVTGGAGEAGKTLLRGDRIGIGSGSQRQVVMVMQDAVADGSGVIALSILPAARWAYAGGASVAWYRPTALFRQVPGDVALSTRLPGLDEGGQINLIESWDA
jgi:hypothetical protein